jgi:hypothetical protein
MRCTFAPAVTNVNTFDEDAVQVVTAFVAWVVTPSLHRSGVIKR